MPWWGWVILAFLALSVICALIKAAKDVVGEVILTVVLWVLAFPIMLIIKIVQAIRGNKREEKKKKEK